MLTLVTALAWIAFDVYHASVDTTISAQTEELLSPITPKFDKATLTSIKKRQKIDPASTAEIKPTLPLPSPRQSSPSSAATQSGVR